MSPDVSFELSASQSRDWPVNCRSFLMNSSSGDGVTVTAEVEYENGQTADIVVRKGQKNYGKIVRVKFSADGTTTINVRFQTGEDPIDPPGTSEDLAVAITSSSPLSKPGVGGAGTPDEDVLAGAEGEVIGANSNRVALMLFRIDTGTDPIRWEISDSALGSGQGGILWEKDSAILPTTGAVRVRNPTGSTVTVGFQEILKET